MQPATGPIILFCLIHGEPSTRAFPVQINRECTVALLREFIVHKNSNYFKRTDPRLLRLSMVSIKDDDDAALAGFDPTDSTVMLPTRKISKLFPQEPPEDHIHVIVTLGVCAFFFFFSSIMTNTVYHVYANMYIPRRGPIKQPLKHGRQGEMSI